MDLVRDRIQAPDIIPIIKDKVREHDLQYVGIERVDRRQRQMCIRDKFL